MEKVCTLEDISLYPFLTSVLWVKVSHRDKIMTGRSFGGNVNLIAPL